MTRYLIINNKKYKLMQWQVELAINAVGRARVDIYVDFLQFKTTWFKAQVSLIYHNGKGRQQYFHGLITGYKIIQIYQQAVIVRCYLHSNLWHLQQQTLPRIYKISNWQQQLSNLLASHYNQQQLVFASNCLVNKFDYKYWHQVAGVSNWQALLDALAKSKAVIYHEMLEQHDQLKIKTLADLCQQDLKDNIEFKQVNKPGQDLFVRNLPISYHHNISTNKKYIKLRYHQQIYQLGDKISCTVAGIHDSYFVKRMVLQQTSDRGLDVEVYLANLDPLRLKVINSAPKLLQQATIASAESAAGYYQIQYPYAKEVNMPMVPSLSHYLADQQHNYGFVSPFLANSKVLVSYLENDPQQAIILGAMRTASHSVTQAVWPNNYFWQSKQNLHWRINSQRRTMCLSTAAHQQYLRLADNDHNLSCYADSSISKQAQRIDIKTAQFKLQAKQAKMQTEGLSINNTEKIKMHAKKITFNSTELKQQHQTYQLESADCKIKALDLQWQVAHKGKIKIKQHAKFSSNKLELSAADELHLIADGCQIKLTSSGEISLAATIVSLGFANINCQLG